jgi:hypothetical protein
MVAVAVIDELLEAWPHAGSEGSYGTTQGHDSHRKAVTRAKLGLVGTSTPTPKSGSQRGEQIGRVALPDIKSCPIFAGQAEQSAASR